VIASGLGTLLLSLAPAARQAVPRQAPPVDELLQQQVFVLLTATAQDGLLQRQALLDELTDLGAQLAPIAAGILCGEIAVPDTVPGSKPEQQADPRLVELRDGLLRDALARLDQGVVVDHLARRAAGDAPLEVRLSVARLLGEARHPRTVDVLLQIAGGIEPIHLARSYVLQSFEQPLAEALRADPRADASLSGRVARLSAEVRDLLLRAAVQADSPATRRFLCSRLTAAEVEQPIVLGAIAASRPGAFDAAPEEVDALRARLSSPEPHLRRMAALALGKLEDRGSAAALIELLSGDETLEVAAAHEALRWITGSDLGRKPERWIDWLTAEQAWWEVAAPIELQRLGSGDRHLVHRALQELLRHPLFRHEVAPEVARLLTEPDDQLASAGCGALAALGSREPLPAMLELLPSAEGDRRAALLRALQALARRDPALRDYLASLPAEAAQS
jgi:HEAT repeat protein